MSRLLPLIIVVLFPLFTSCTGEAKEIKADSAQSTDETTVVEGIKPVTLEGMKRAFVSRGIYLGSQPDENALKAAQSKLACKAVINLRMPREMATFAEEKIVSDLGMSYTNIPLGMPKSFTDESFEKARQVLRDSKNRPMMMHCAGGARVGAIWYAYLVLDCSVKPEEALAEAKTLGTGPGHLARAEAYVKANSK